MFDLAILDALPDALLLVRNEAVAWASGGAGRLLGVPAERLVGKSLWALLAPGERERLRTLERQRATGWAIPDTCRIRFVRDGGTEVPCDLRFAIAATTEGETLVLAARDVTEVTRAEQLMGKLAALSQRQSVMVDADALLDASEPVFAELGWKGALTAILEDSSITLRAVAAPPGDPIGDYVRTLVGRQVPLAQTPILAEVKRTGQALFLDNAPGFLAGPPRGAVALNESMTRARLTRSVWCPVRVGGRVSHLLALAGKDMTEHDFVAVQLFAAQIGAAMHASELRAELVRRERLAAVGEMAAVLAHEVRNPLAIIFNALGALGKLPAASDQAAPLLGIVGEESERLRRLVGDLLDFARPQAAELGPVDVRPFLSQAIEAARQDPMSAGVPATCDVVLPEELAPAEADPFLLRRALVNLAVNALQHVTPGGRVTLSAGASGGEVRITVDNDGPPIAAEVAGRIFEPFVTTQATGTGLGLAIVRRIVEDMRGRVELVPRDGGVTFAIALAASPPAPDRR